MDFEALCAMAPPGYCPAVALVCRYVKDLKPVACVNRSWRQASVSPVLWRELLRRTPRKKPPTRDIEAARHGLGAVPSSAFIELRDSLTAAGRASGPFPSQSTVLILDACCKVLGRPGGTPRHWVAALEGPPKMAVALKKLDVSRLDLDDLRRVVYKFPSRPKQILVARLAAWCAAAVALADKLDEQDVCKRAEAAAKLWVKLCTPAMPRRKSSSAPPAPPTLYDIFVDSKRQSPQTEDVDRCARMLARFYERHNPALVPRARAVAQEWKGHESTLFALLRYKYQDGPKPVRRSSLPPAPHSNGPRVDDLRKEIRRLRTTVDKAQTEAEKANSRAKAAIADARRARKSLLDDRSESAKLREEKEALRKLRDEQDNELKRLRTLKSPVVEEVVEVEMDEDDAAVEAVTKAVVDVLLTEAAIEIDFERDYADPAPPRARRPPQRSRSTSPARVMPLVPIAAIDER